MGKSSTPTYRLEIMTHVMAPEGIRPQQSGEAWVVKGVNGARGRGTPTEANLERYIIAYAKSLEAGGVNAHVSTALGQVPYPNSAKIIHQKSGSVMATWKAAQFQVW